jgi:hypothetical protein
MALITQDIQVKYYGGSARPVTLDIPKGTVVDRLKDGRGRPVYAVASPEELEGQAWKHDLEHYHVWVPEQYVNDDTRPAVHD